MPDFDEAFPPLLAELHMLEPEYSPGEEIDFEPYQQFRSAEDNASWIAAWTGNKALKGAEYRVFGQDGSGGYVALWLVRPAAPLLEQPIVFFGSEGELGVVACNFADYLWLLAGGGGPMEAISYPDDERTPNAELTEFAMRHAKSAKKTPNEVIAAAAAAFPTFEKDVRALCK